MNPNNKAFAAVRLNGIVEDWGEGALKYIPVRLAKFIMDTELDSRAFSSLEVRLSKRPIVWESPEELGGLDASLFVQTEDSEPIDEIGDISYGEFDALSNDPIWTQYQELRSNSARFTPEEQGVIAYRWISKYQDTKYQRLIRKD